MTRADAELTRISAGLVVTLDISSIGAKPLPQPPPARAGLSHVCKEFEEEFFAPFCAAHFAGEGFVEG
ncbi:hypothetical protein AB4Z01_35970, partial [Inquilinus sp. YAF38]|uniref:hypothetical protein n=1 Tax=Inquilinus sp. YAF38 TaxID=3233084 RepID=UPI003F9140CB